MQQESNPGCQPLRNQGAKKPGAMNLVPSRLRGNCHLRSVCHEHFLL